MQIRFLVLVKLLGLFCRTLRKTEIFLRVGTGDPLSVTDSVIAVAGPAFRSAKTRNEAIASFANAPELLRDLGKGLGILQNVLQP